MQWVTKRDETGFSPARFVEDYTHDELNRVTNAKASADGSASAQAKWSSNWTLDTMGNWVQSGLQTGAVAATSTVTESRQHNAANELISSNDQDLVDDPAGNLIAHVPARENSMQGGHLTNFYAKHSMQPSDQFRVRVCR